MAELEQDEARDAIQLKGSSRDPEQTRRVLAQWLAPRIGAGPDLAVSPLTTPSGTGVANETVMFDAVWTAAGRERTQGFVARFASERTLYIEVDIQVHAKTYQALGDVPGVPVPRVYGYEADRGLLGAPFFVMERIEGQVPSDQPHWTGPGFVRDADPPRRRAMWEDAVRVLATLHLVEPSRFPFLTPPAGLSGLGDHLAYWRRYVDVASVGLPHDTLEHGYEWLLAHLPDPAPTGFSWGDARFANIMFRDDGVVAIFDWDTVSLAGAEADLAWWRYMDGPAAAELPGIGTADELVRRWEEHTGRKAQHLEWHDVFTCFRLGAIMLRLFANMAADGVMAPGDAERQGRESAPTLALAGHLRALA
ncbi:MAG TPA: phosphotransferase family protein [Acidimicrobiales bacterium]|nr:phosphotransferase family protein [Acidimicrobiales bacterium]